MLTVQQAETTILDLVQPLNSQQDREIISLEAALGRILATPVTSSLDFPHWDNSAMDGYAVRFADVHNCSVNQTVILEIVEEIQAGYQPRKLIQTGQASRIFTGGMMPEGADTVVMQENTRREGNYVTILTAPQPQAFVRYRGSFYQAGNPLLMQGIALEAADIAVLAAAQCTELNVYRRPRIAIFSTGNELVSPKQPLQLGQIVDSNQYALAAFVASQGGIPLKLGIVPDHPDTLKNTISQAIDTADVVLSTGGVSVGEYDYVEQILAELGGEIHIRSIAVKPGKPLTVATFANGCLYFGIPGNPVSALVSCWRFVEPALHKLSGLAANWYPTFVKARSRQELHSGGQRETYIWGKLQLLEGIYEFQQAGGSHSSGNLINLAKANGLAVIPVGKKIIQPGEFVKVMAIR